MYSSRECSCTWHQSGSCLYPVHTHQRLWVYKERIIIIVDGVHHTQEKKEHARGCMKQQAELPVTQVQCLSVQRINFLVAPVRMDHLRDISHLLGHLATDLLSIYIQPCAAHKITEFQQSTSMHSFSAILYPINTLRY